MIYFFGNILNYVKLDIVIYKTNSIGVSMKNLYAILLALSIAAGSIKAEDNIIKVNSCNVQIDQDLRELLDLLMQKDILMKSMEGVFEQTSRGLSEDVSEEALAKTDQNDMSKKMLNRFVEKFDSKDVKDEMIALYHKYYTNEEISELLKFYRSPLGMKTIEKMPELMNESSQITIKIVQDTMMEFMPLDAQQDLEISEE